MASLLQRIKCWRLPANNLYMQYESDNIRTIELSEPSFAGSLLVSSIYSDIPAEFWGSTEEYEVQCVLRGIISCALGSQCTKMVLGLRNLLESCSTGWIDRFVICLGIQVLHKLLADIVLSEGARNEDTVIRENALLHCFNKLYSRSVLAQELTIGVSNEKVLKTILSCLLSPNEGTRVLASETILILKGYLGSPSKILCTIKLSGSRRYCKVISP